MPGLEIEYRPKTFNEMVGNKNIISSISSQLDRDKDGVPHAFLLHGESGCGKTTTARIIASKLGCRVHSKNSDFVELDTAHFTGVDTARDIRNTMVYSPISSECRVWILDEFHKASTAFQSAMLKALEDAPKHCYFILCTTEPKKLLKTIRNRCSTFKVSKLEEKEIIQVIDGVLKQEKFSIPDDVKKEIAAVSDGCPRQALVILDQVIDLPEDKMLGSVGDGIEEDKKEIKDLCQALLKGKSWKIIAEVLKVLKGTEPETIRRAVIGYMSAVLLNSGSAKPALIIDVFKDNVFDSGMPGIILNCYETMG